MKHVLRTLRDSGISLVLLFTLVFFLVRIVPGDPAQLMAGAGVSEQEIALLREKFGLDDPIWQQLLNYFLRLLEGDLGTSTLNGRPVTDQILSGLSATLPLLFSAMCLAVAFAVPAGIIAAFRQNRAADLAATSLAVGLTSVPAFWFGLVLIEVFPVNLRWLPSSGAGSWRHLILPAIVLASTQIGLITRLTRGSVIEVLQMDYIRTARAKGASFRRIVLAHVLRNAAVPTVTVVGLQSGMLLGGAVVTETVFNWPGVGRLLIQSVLYRDYPLLQGLILLFGVTFVVINLLVDLTNMTIDPRLRA